MPYEISAQAVAQFNRRIFRRMAEKYGGECTINEVRVMNQIVCCHLDGRPCCLDGWSCCVTSLHKLTGIPIPTVSRCVTKLHADGWLSTNQDPDDGRKRVISLSPRSLNETLAGVSRSVRWLKNFRNHGLPT